MRTHLPVAMVLLLLPAGALAAPCERLDAAQKKQAEAIFAATYPYECCDETLARCLKQKKVCKLARRLRDDICRRLGRNQDAKAIKDALDRRARSMSPMGKKAEISLAGFTAAGAPVAKVTVVVFACARCPFCSKVVPDLYRMVDSGELKGKVKLYLKAFPIKGHAGSAEGGMAFMAAGRLGKFWEYVMKLYGQFEKFDVGKLSEWATEVGMDRAAFAQALKDKALRDALVESKKEGLRMGVKATPTLFVNGRQYFGDMDHDSVLDMLGEEVDRQDSRQYCDGP